jgi:hypothetical protein
LIIGAKVVQSARSFKIITISINNNNAKTLAATTSQSIKIKLPWSAGNKIYI